MYINLFDLEKYWKTPFYLKKFFPFTTWAFEFLIINPRSVHPNPSVRRFRNHILLDWYKGSLSNWYSFWRDCEVIMLFFWYKVKGWKFKKVLAYDILWRKRAPPRIGKQHQNNYKSMKRTPSLQVHQMNPDALAHSLATPSHTLRWDHWYIGF